MEETREALVQKLLDIYSKEGNYETSVPGVWVHRSERNKVPKPHIYQPMMIFPEFYRRITDNFKRAFESQGFSSFLIFSLLW